MRAVFVFVFCLLLCACGFHLRGSQQETSLPFADVYVSSNPKEPMIRQLTVALASLDVLSNELSDWQLHVTTPKLKTYPLAYGPNGELVRETLELKVTYTLMHNKEVIQTKTMRNQRQHQLNIATQLADRAELETILKEMEHDLVQQMIIHLSRV